MNPIAASTTASTIASITGPITVAAASTVAVSDDLVARIVSNLNLTDEVLTRSGDYSNGFYTWVLSVDLDELQAGDEDCFSVFEQHDTAGIAMDTYNGMNCEARLPDGAIVTGIARFCADLLARREELTFGYTEFWDGSNHVGRFRVPEVDEDEEVEDGALNALAGEERADETRVEDVREFWHQFGDAVEAIDTAEVYDISFEDNYRINVRDRWREILASVPPAQWIDADAVGTALASEFVSDAKDTWFTGHSLAATKLVEDIKAELVEEEEQEDGEPVAVVFADDYDSDGKLQLVHLGKHGEVGHLDAQDRGYMRGIRTCVLSPSKYDRLMELVGQETGDAFRPFRVTPFGETVFIEEF